MDDSKRSLRTIFNEALEIEEVQARADYLSGACGSDPSLRKKIEELIDADAAAGGFLAEAEKSQVNLARLVEDGEKLDILYIEGASPIIPTPGATVIAATTDLIDINIASQAELESLPGIGPTTAQKIIEYREQNGPFLAIEDIVNVSGIGPGTYERIKDLITVTTGTNP